MTKDPDELVRISKEKLNDLLAFEAKLAIAIEALEFYANLEYPFEDSVTIDDYEFGFTPRKKGFIAKRALAKIKNE